MIEFYNWLNNKDKKRIIKDFAVKKYWLQIWNGASIFKFLSTNIFYVIFLEIFRFE